METRKMHCIMCPKGCEMTVTTDGGKFVSVTGNSCPNGAKYAQQEVAAPMRMLTGTVRIKNGPLPLLPVVSKTMLPKDLIVKAAAELRTVEVTAPIKYGTVVLTNILGTGVDIIASCDFPCVK